MSGGIGGGWRRRFDRVFSLGAACCTAQAIKDAGFRRESLPFDWIHIGDFRTRIDLILRNFDGMWRLENLYLSSRPVEDENHLAVGDDTCDMLSGHDFPIGKTIAESLPDVRRKFDRRNRRLLKWLASGRSLLLVYFYRQPSEHDVDYVRIFRRLQDAYSMTKLSLLLIHADGGPLREEILSEDVARVNGDFMPEGSTWRGNQELFALILSKVRLSWRFSLRRWIDRVQLPIARLLVNLVPSKTSRHRLRSRYVKD